jgi:hypothetical protein
MSRNVKYTVKSVTYQIARKPPITNGKKAGLREKRSEQDSLENETGNGKKPEVDRNFDVSRILEISKSHLYAV